MKVGPNKPWHPTKNLVKQITSTFVGFEKMEKMWSSCVACMDASEQKIKEMPLAYSNWNYHDDNLVNR